MPKIGQLLGAGNIAEVYAYGPHVLKLYRDGGKAQAFAEAATMALINEHDLPAPRVYSVGEHNGRWGLVMDRAPGPQLFDPTDPSPDVTAIISEMLRLHRLIHAASELRIRPLKPRLAAAIARAPLEPALRNRLLAGLAALPDGDRICHGDFHPLNIMGPPGNTLVVDWPDATSGDPAADVCRSYVLLMPRVPDLAELYVARYADASGLTRGAILAWQSCVAAARMIENVPDEMAALRAMAEAV